MRIDAAAFITGEYIDAFEKDGFSAFIVSIDPEQTYFPKIASRALANGQMVSNPLHRMVPDLPENVKSKVFKYIGME